MLLSSFKHSWPVSWLVVLKRAARLPWVRTPGAVSPFAMAPPKRDSSDAQGMRAISSFFAPKTNIVSAKAPPIGKPSPMKDDRASKAAKTDASDAPGSARKTRDAPHSARSPDAPATASAKKSSGFRDPRRRSTSGAEEDPKAKDPPTRRLPDAAEIEPGAGVSATLEDDVGRRVAVWWPKEKKFYPARISAVDAKRGKHHVRYDDGDDEWIALSKRRCVWDSRADAVAAEKFAALGEEDDDIVSEKSEDDSETDDVDESESSRGWKSKKRSRTTARGAAAAAALAKVAGRRPARAAAKRPRRAVR